VVGEGAYSVDKFINEVTVVVTPPQEDDITEFVGIFIKEVGTAVYDTIDEAQRGAFSATPYVGTLGNQGVSPPGGG